MFDQRNRCSTDGVYRRGGAGVNPRQRTARLMRARVLAAGLSALTATGLGCAPLRVEMSPYPVAEFYPVGIWYGVETARVIGGGDASGQMDRDLATVSRMGLNTVFLRHLDAAGVPAATAAARRHHLKMVLPDRPAQYYVVTGGSETGGSGTGLAGASGVRLAGGAGADSGPLWAVDIGLATDRRSVERLQRVAALYNSDPSLPATFARTAGPLPASGVFRTAVPAGDTLTPLPVRQRSAGRPMMTLCCDHRPQESSGDAVRRWLWRFHAGLARGLTGGLVIDQYRRIPGRGAALADADGAVDVRRINTIRRIAERMQRWGSMLNRLELKPFAAPRGTDDSLSITLFSRNRRRLLLVFNRSESEYVRTTITLDGQLDALSITRLVEVPGDVSVALGAVTKARRGCVALNLNIAPGDARLYEVF